MTEHEPQRMLPESYSSQKQGLVRSIQASENEKALNHEPLTFTLRTLVLNHLCLEGVGCTFAAPKPSHRPHPQHGGL